MCGQEIASGPKEDKNSMTMNNNENYIDKMIKSKEKQLEVYPIQLQKTQMSKLR